MTLQNGSLLRANILSNNVSRHSMKKNVSIYLHIGSPPFPLKVSSSSPPAPVIPYPCKGIIGRCATICITGHPLPCS